MSRGVRCLGTIGRARVWYFADAASFARAFPAYTPAPSVRGVWVDVDGMLLRATPDLWPVVQHHRHTGRAARVLRGLYQHAGGGL